MRHVGRVNTPFWLPASAYSYSIPDRLIRIPSQVFAETASIMMVEANGLYDGGLRSTQWLHMETRVNSEALPKGLHLMHP